MLSFLKQKIKNRKWLMLCMFLGNLLLIAVLCCITMYSEAVQVRILERRMNAAAQESKTYPMQLNLNATLTVVSSKRHTGESFAKLAEMAEDFAKGGQIPVKEYVTRYTASSKSETVLKRSGKALTGSLQVGYISKLSDNIEIVDGTEYVTGTLSDGSYPVIVSEKFLASQKMIVGETVIMKDLKDEKGQKLHVTICGVFKAKDPSDIYWVKQPYEYDTVMFMPEETFETLFVNFTAPKNNIRGFWNILFDYSDLSREQIEMLLAKTSDCAAYVEQVTALNLNENYTEELGRFLYDDNQTEKTLWILQAPILVLLLTFIMMVSKQMLMLEQAEIAVFKSRGASGRQIIRIYILQSLILALAACIPGVALGALLCQLLGSANAFLEFVGRSSLRINILNIKLLIECVGAVLVSVLVTVIPVIKYSDTSTVKQKQKRRRHRTDMPVWQRFGLDFIVLGIGIYGWYSFRGQEESLRAQVLEGKSLNVLLYFSSVIFILGAGLVVTRLVHLIPKIIYLLGKRIMGPATYASFMMIMRSSASRNFIVVFLILTIALGIFNADTARTVNANDENNVRYLSGADIRLQEQWHDNSAIVASDRTATISLAYSEPEMKRFTEIEGVTAAARVYYNNAEVSYNKASYYTELVGIDTKEFGLVSQMPDGLLEKHWYEYLNILSNVSDGLLVASAFREYGGMQLGDTLHYTVNGIQLKGTICGFLDYFPAIAPTYTFTDQRGREQTVPNTYIVANLAYLQTMLGVEPYEVWLKVDTSTDSIYDYLKENNIAVKDFHDMSISLANHKNDALLQGTNGMLTIGFLIVLTLCVIGFMIFWILSIRQRTLQFGVFRAMGQTMPEIVHMIALEQIFVTGISVAAGVATGMISSKLFVPLIQIAYTREENVLPLQVIQSSADTERILITVGIMIVACICSLGVFISKTGIAQALKLGEDS